MMLCAGAKVVVAVYEVVDDGVYGSWFGWM